MTKYKETKEWLYSLLWIITGLILSYVCCIALFIIPSTNSLWYRVVLAYVFGASINSLSTIYFYKRHYNITRK